MSPAVPAGAAALVSGLPEPVGPDEAASVPVVESESESEEGDLVVAVVAVGTPALSEVVVPRTNVAVGTGAVPVAPVALPVMGPGPWLPVAV